MQQAGDKEKFSVRKRVRSFGHAMRGMSIFFSYTHNSWIQLLLLVLAAALGGYFRISITEWLFIIMASGLVFATEAINTAIEIHMDLTSPDEHPFARDTKDVAAGAVLIASITAAIIGIVIFGPHIVAHFR